MIPQGYIIIFLQTWRVFAFTNLPWCEILYKISIKDLLYARKQMYFSLRKEKKKKKQHPNSKSKEANVMWNSLGKNKYSWFRCPFLISFICLSWRKCRAELRKTSGITSHLSACSRINCIHAILGRCFFSLLKTSEGGNACPPQPACLQLCPQEAMS